MKSIQLLKTAIKQLQNGERTCIGCVVRQVEKEMKQFHDDAFTFSAELTYKDRLIKEYEQWVPAIAKAEIQRHIFSEDDR